VQLLDLHNWSTWQKFRKRCGNGDVSGCKSMVEELR